jgi:hypothetical protein
MTGVEPVSRGDVLRDLDTALNADPRTNGLASLAEYQQEIAKFQLIDLVPYDVRVHFETAKNLYLYAWFVYRFFPVAEKHALASLEFALRLRLAPMFPNEFGPDAARPAGMRALLKRARRELLISNDGLRATRRQALQRARERVSNQATRKLIETGAEFVEYEAWDVELEPEDFSDDPLGTFLKTLPGIRNDYAHGSATLHSSVLGMFEIVCDLVNDLYRARPS